MSEARQQVTRVDEAPVPSTQSEVAIINLIERLATNPDANVETVERLFALREKALDREAEKAFHEAMNAAQADMRRVVANAHNPQTKSKYADYPALDRAVRPVYAKHGFSLSFNTGEGAPTDYVRVVCIVGHTDGHSRDYHVDMPADGKGAKGGDVMTKTHAVGAAMSYGQRYLLKLIFNIAVGEDNDGNSNGGGAREMSEAAKDAIADINAYDDPAGLVLWKKNKSASVEKSVAPAEWKQIVALWNRRAAALKGPGQ